MTPTADIQGLKDEAARASSSGDHARALAAYEKLERLEPESAHWPKRIGEMHRRLGQIDEAIAAWTRAAERFGRAGFLLKAIAICHLILRQDPQNTEAQKQLAALNEQPTSSPAPRGPGAPLAPPSTDVGSTRGAPLVDVPLDRVVAGAADTGAAEKTSGASVTEIPIVWDDEPAAPPADERAADPPSAGRARKATLDTLSRTPLFSDLSPDALETLIGNIELIEIEPGETVFREGEPGDALYVVAEGRVAVRSTEAPDVLAHLGDGSFFGEIALVTDEPRSATVEATERTELLRVSRDVVSDVVRERREVLGIILAFLRERLIERLVATSPLFAPFAGEERRALAQRFRLLQVGAGAELIRQGSHSAGLFILLCGGAEVHRTEGDETIRIASLGRGDLAGEISLLTGEPAVATVRTTAKLLALEMPPEAFRQIIMTHPQVLAFVGGLAETRRRALRAAIAGHGEYAEESLKLV